MTNFYSDNEDIRLPLHHMDAPRPAEAPNRATSEATGAKGSLPWN